MCPLIFFSYLETLRYFIVFSSCLYSYLHYTIIGLYQKKYFYVFLLAIGFNFLFVFKVFQIKYNVDLSLYDNRSKLFEYMNDALLNLVSIYSTNSEEKEKKIFIDREYKKYKDIETKTLNIYVASEMTWNVVCAILFIILNYLIYRSYLKKQINVEKLVSTFTLTFSVLRFYENAPQIVKKLSKLYSEISDIENFFIEINKLNQTAKIDTKGFDNGDIIYNNVYHKYKDQFVLNNVSLKIKKGEKVALIGHIGSGKTTAVKLLLGFQPLTMGNITIKGVPINEISNSELRKSIFYIPQKPKLFNRSLYDNIVYGLNDPPSEESILELLEHITYERKSSKKKIT